MSIGIIRIIFIGMAVLTVAWGSLAVASSEHDMSVVINLAGKQRMLTQKMTKEVLLIASGVDTSKNKESLSATAALFDKTLKGLVDGSSDLKLIKATDAKAIRQLGKVAKLWSPFHDLVKSVLGGDTSKANLEKIAKDNLPLLKNMNRAVKMFENQAKSAGGKSLDPGMATTINLAGKQRMLTQKMTKELLLVSLGIRADRNRRELKKTSSLFERSLNGLLEGDKDLELSGTKDPKIRAQLSEVQKIWKTYKPVVDRVIASETNKVSAPDIKKAAEVNLPLLKTMNQAVKMYEKSVK